MSMCAFVCVKKKKKCTHLPLVAEAAGLDLLRDALVHEWSQLLLIFDVDELLGARGRVGNIQLAEATTKTRRQEQQQQHRLDIDGQNPI